MSESREQFRDRIRKVGQVAMLISAYPDDTVGQVVDGLEAVYTEALRDFRAYAGEAEYDPYPDMQASGLVDEFAASLGIDLEDEP